MKMCPLPPPGWYCARTPNHPGPCAAFPERTVDDRTYAIVRYYRDSESEVVNRGFTLQQAQTHCNDPKTKGDDWFDGYVREISE